MPGPALDPDQRARLLAAKLRALVDGQWPAAGSSGASAPREPVAVGSSAALVEGDAAWVLVDEAAPHGLGSLLAWTRQRGIRRLVVLADQPGTMARQAGYLADPPVVLRIDGRELRPAVPEPLPVAPEAPEAARALVPELERAGLEVVIEHGVVSGEVLGLEVARVVIGDDGAARIEVGVGRNDREAFAMLHGDLPTEQALGAVVDAVRTHRRPGGPMHPLNRLAAERWLRAHLVNDPSRLPGWELRAVAGPVARTSVSERSTAFATGVDDAGEPVVLACSVGIDLDLVPDAADARAMHLPEARLVLAVPVRDAHAATDALARALEHPAEVLAVEGDWRR